VTGASLVLVIDAIPWELAHQVWEEGHLAGFCEPVPNVSVFPSLTNVAAAALVGPILGGRPLGYEARYYHVPSGTLRGGLGDPDTDRPLALYPDHAEGALAQLASYLFPRLATWAEVSWLVHRFVRQGGSWLAYVSATDGVAHFGGRDPLRTAFRDLALRIVDARRALEREHQIPPPVVLASDHGMAFGPVVHVSSLEFARALEGAGFARESSPPEGFFLPAMGEVSAGVCFVAPDRAATAARALARLEGVDVTIARQTEHSALVVRGSEEAVIHWRMNRYRYCATQGDPLEYLPVWSALDRRKEVASDGFIDGEVLLTSTWSHGYPDALHRIRRALTDLVEFPAPLLFSMGRGHTCGPHLTHAGAAFLGGLAGTHGGLGMEESLGFLSVAELPAPPPVVRTESALLPYRDLVVRGAGAQATR
jgi:hypothetical protein